jgi:hypothetical protein
MNASDALGRVVLGVSAGVPCGIVGGLILWPMSLILYGWTGEAPQGWQEFFIGGSLVGAIAGGIALGRWGRWDQLLFSTIGAAWGGGSIGSTVGIAVWRLAAVVCWLLGYDLANQSLFCRVFQVPLVVYLAIAMAWSDMDEFWKKEDKPKATNP